MRPFRVLTAEWIHETNTFNRKRTTVQSFIDRYSYTGPAAIAERGAESHNTELSGFLQCQRDFEWECVHVLSCAAAPSGVVTNETFEIFATQITAAIEENLHNLDGILLSLHGAMVVESFDDGEGELLRRIRAIIGSRPASAMDKSPLIAITLDLHANVSEQMTTLSDIVVSYKTYPHTDMRECGIHAGRILQRAMKKEIDPVTIRRYIPLLEEANGGRTDVGAMVARINQIVLLERTVPGILALSINAGFPTDISGCDVGPTVLCTYDRKESPREVYQTIIDDIALDIWEKRADVINKFYSVEEAVQIAVDFTAAIALLPAEAKKPLIIADYADNPGAGSYGDSTNLLREMMRRGISNAVVAPMVDPELANLIVTTMDCHAGDVIEEAIEIGGKADPRHGGAPIRVTGAKVMLTSSKGTYVGSGPMITGLTLMYGKTCVLRIEDRIDVLVVSEPEQLLDQAQLTAFDIDPRAKDVIALKSMQHFRAAFEPIAGKVIVCDSGAIATPDVSKLTFTNVTRPIYPLDKDFSFKL